MPGSCEYVLRVGGELHQCGPEIVSAGLVFPEFAPKHGATIYFRARVPTTNAVSKVFKLRGSVHSSETDEKSDVARVRVAKP
jgi:hypothetical protein